MYNESLTKHQLLNIESAGSQSPTRATTFRNSVTVIENSSQTALKLKEINASTSQLHSQLLSVRTQLFKAKQSSTSPLKENMAIKYSKYIKSNMQLELT